MISKEQHLQVQLRKVLVAMETKRTDFDNIRQDVKKVKKIFVFLVSCGVIHSLLSCGICACNSDSCTRLVLQCFFVTDTIPNLETAFIKDSNLSDMRKSFNDHLDKIEKQTVEEMVSVEQNLQVQLKIVLVFQF
jgi:hypothetical protein